MQFFVERYTRVYIPDFSTIYIVCAVHIFELF